MEQILISSCLVGSKVRYNGGHCSISDETIREWQEQGILVSFCPEVYSGLPVPRQPAEIQEYANKGKVEELLVLDKETKDLTAFYIRGADKALQLCKTFSIKLAILKEYSPSCGVHKVYDGTFSGKKIEGMGVTTSTLQKGGVSVFSEYQIRDALEFYKTLRR
jgi:uncharacterized protein YbbK (DUF523 family)